MEFNNSKPIYLQIIDYIKKQLIRGELKGGDKISSQREFAQQMKVNPNTVQRAYREMESMQLVETIRGQGTFICNQEEMLAVIQEEMAGDLLRHFIEEMYSLGYSKEAMVQLIEKWKTEVREEEK
ncbi:regulatory protein GntR, HTH [Alkaliphilus metalliredigens QYMF]|uniref:Regulatory protein GntR, HTH n=1 Tax=Alkaliphilus metalliredigens (strain QYMF) TaxID=293826 RepID=A6TJK3_ALKMQ|nr:GntR family transcriptional regulator [Alkaliphilus metalliredigens]ABR46371.1 regulatory protein GntR, HTH [Alkaliphilus metalliredigens QYMF]